MTIKGPICRHEAFQINLFRFKHNAL
jgi:hypothetical protein